MINLEDLLKPISEEKPCGEDFSYHPTFQNLESLSKGKPETQFSPAEEPEWKEVRDAALEVLGQSKHIGAAVFLTTALLKTEGISGFRDGLALIHGLVEKYWAGVYPALDPDDNNDPTERLNVLGNLSSPKFIVQVRQLVLCSSQGIGNITLEQYITMKEKVTQPEGAEKDKNAKPGPDSSQIQAALTEAGTEAAKSKLAAVEEAIIHAKGIETFVDTTLGVGNGVNFVLLNKTLAEFKNAVAPHAGSGDAPPGDAAAGDAQGQAVDDAPASGGGGSGSAVAKSGNKLSGTIQTRADVIKCLGMIYDYYGKNEPSSPVPLVLKRAERLVEKDFLEIVKDLTPDSMKQLRMIAGLKDEE